MVDSCREVLMVRDETPAVHWVLQRGELLLL